MWPQKATSKNRSFNFERKKKKISIYNCHILAHSVYMVLRILTDLYRLCENCSANLCHVHDRSHDTYLSLFYCHDGVDSCYKTKLNTILNWIPDKTLQVKMTVKDIRLCFTKWLNNGSQLWTFLHFIRIIFYSHKEYTKITI